jgi:hypothetical protein
MELRRPSFATPVRRHTPITGGALLRVKNGQRTWTGWLVACGLPLWLAGCAAPPAPFDPFLAGRTTIPPPGTAVAAAPATPPPYDVSPPVVTVPGAPIYTPPATAAPVSPSALPAASSPRFPRGITLPQSRNEPQDHGVELAGWQPADSIAGRASTGASAETPEPSKGAVIQASHSEPSKEPPLRIVEPK